MKAGTKEEIKKGTGVDRSLGKNKWKRKLFLGCDGVDTDVGVFLLKTLDAACRIDQLLLAGEEWMAIGADFNAQHIAFDCGTCGECIPAGAMHGYSVVVGVDTGFHVSPICRVRSARAGACRLLPRR